MFIDVNSLQVKYGNNAYVNLGPYLVEAQYSYNKVWADDSGRNLAGTMAGTLIGVFPKIVCHFKRLNKSEVETIVKILDSPRQTLKYYDPYKQAVREMTTYTGDYEVLSKHVIDNNRPVDNFEVSFIAVSKRT